MGENEGNLFTNKLKDFTDNNRNKKRFLVSGSLKIFDN